MKIQIKHKTLNIILFEHDCKQNTVRKTLEIGINRGANLEGANLGGADLVGANLEGANLGGADLGGAYLGGAYLGGANLEWANLGGAYLGGANLKGANLEGTNLGGANLEWANLEWANLGVKVPPLNDYCFISEILWHNAKTEPQKDFAGRILRERKCWEYFYQLAQLKQVSDWAEEVLSQWQIYKDKIQVYKNNEQK